MAPSDIKTANDFHAVFPQHRIDSRNNSFVSISGWNTTAGLKQIREWLKVVAVDQIRMYQRIKVESEAALYPLILTTLLPVFDLCDCDVVGNVVGDGLDEEDRERLVSEIILSRAQKSSRQASVESAVQPSGQLSDADRAAVTSSGTALLSDPPAPSTQEDSGPPVVVDTTDWADVMKFVVYIEETLKSTLYPIKGTVEILVKNKTTDENVAVVEAKPHIGDNRPDDAGLYQCCAYMAMTNTRFGVYTDHGAYQFVYMDEQRVLRRSKLFALVRRDNEGLDAQAAQVYAHLFEIMGVPRNTDLVAKATEASATWRRRAEAFVQ